MTSTATSDAMRAIAAKLVWWKAPEEALSDPIDFACRVMTLGTWDDIMLVRRELGDELLKQALRQPRAGIFDARSWRYWHLVFDITPEPPLPKRVLQ